MPIGLSIGIAPWDFVWLRFQLDNPETVSMQQFQYQELLMAAWAKRILDDGR